MASVVSATCTPRRRLIRDVRQRKTTSTMPEYADIYVLGSERTEQAIGDFLDHFLPSRIESADEYEIPQYSESPDVVYTKASDLIRHCCKNRNEVHTIYWRSDAQPEHVMIFFLRDGALIYGISTPADVHQQVDRVAADLGVFLDTEKVIVSYEDLPPESSEGFHAHYGSLPPNPGEAARRCRAHRPIKKANKSCEATGDNVPS